MQIVIIEFGSLKAFIFLHTALRLRVLHTGQGRETERLALGPLPSSTDNGEGLEYGFRFDSDGR